MRTHLKPDLTYEPEKQFSRFMERLRQNARAEWTWLLDMFRERVVPWLFKKDGNLPHEAIVSVDEFIEEIFANSLFRFYEMFPAGEFHDLGDLRGLIFRIAELKLKEGYHRIRRDGLIYFTDDVTKDGVTTRHDQLTVAEFEERERIQGLREHLRKLKPTEREILIRYSKGEELGSIAENLGIGAAACRKRKQRALEKLKNLISKEL